MIYVCCSWLHLFGKSKKQSYKVSRRKKPSSSSRSPGRTQQYRQTRYRHIAESRNSAVIPNSPICSNVIGVRLSGL